MKLACWNFYEDGVTQSLIGRWLTCRQKCSIGLLEQLTPKTDRTPLAFGQLVHRVLEKTYRAGNPDHIGSVIEEVAETLRPKDPAAFEEFELLVGWAEALLPRYFAFWGKKDFTKMQWETLEESFEMPWTLASGNQTILRGKLDGVYRAGKGLWLMEHKTKGQIREDFLIDQLGFELQCMWYLTVVREQYGETPKGINYNILRRPGLRRTQKETLSAFVGRCREDILARPEHYFQRFEVAVTEAEFDRWHEEFEVILAEFETWAEDPRLWTYRNSGACSIYGTCEFMPICSSGNRAGYEAKTSHFPELEEE